MNTNCARLHRWLWEILIIGYCFTLPSDAQNSEKVTISRVKYEGGGDWYGDPTSLPNLLVALQKRCGIPTAPHDDTVELIPSQLRNYPLLYLTGHGTVQFSPAHVKALREYLIGGGFLWADDNFGMDKSFREQMAKVFPELSWQLLPPQHPLFSAYYDFPDGIPKIHEHDGGPPQALALFWGDRMVCLYTFDTDIGDGLESEGVHPQDSPEKRESALRMAINIVIYVLTS